jgi:hypothetical protein
VAAKFRIEDSLLLVHGVVPMRAAPFRNGLEGPSEALLHRLDMDRELPSPAERTLVRQAEKVEGVRLCPRPDRRVLIRNGRGGCNVGASPSTIVLLLQRSFEQEISIAGTL